MKTMRNLLTVAVFGAASVAGVAHAEPVLSGNVALTTDYQFRGISQSAENPAVQGGFDYGNGAFYAGVWGSSIDFGATGTTEIDIYAGFKPIASDTFTLDVGVVGYLYPGLDDDAAEADYVELKLAGTFVPAAGLTLGAAAFYSPEFTFDGGDGLYVEATGAFAVNDVVTLSGAVGNQSVDAATYFVDGTTSTDSYTTWNLGGTVALHGFGLDLRYVDTDLDNDLADERVIFSIRRAL
jgi:uncharacterized protein (TIGR02001 family)